MELELGYVSPESSVKHHSTGALGGKAMEQLPKHQLPRLADLSCPNLLGLEVNVQDCTGGTGCGSVLHANGN